MTISKQQLVEAMADSMMEHIPSSPFFREYNKDDPDGYEWARGLAIILGDAALLTLCKALPEPDSGYGHDRVMETREEHALRLYLRLKSIGATDV